MRAQLKRAGTTPIPWVSLCRRYLSPMFRRLALCMALAAVLPAAFAIPAPPASAPSPSPLRLHLRVVDACPLEQEGADTACRAVHRRSDDAAPAPPQVQALTPPMENGPEPARAWQTLTF